MSDAMSPALAAPAQVDATIPSVPVPAVVNPHARQAVPRPELLFALRHLGYTNQSAILDLVDNSIDAESNNVRVVIDDALKFIQVIDDGYGMSLEKLCEALRLGRKNEHVPGDLGVFGMGMKSASLSLGRRLTVLTMAENGGLSEGILDMDAMIASDSWDVMVRPVTDQGVIDAFHKEVGANHGTIVTVDKIDRVTEKMGKKLVDNIIHDTGWTYFRLLKQQAPVLNLSLNGIPVRPVDPLEPQFEQRCAELGVNPIMHRAEPIAVEFTNSKGVTSPVFLEFFAGIIKGGTATHTQEQVTKACLDIIPNSRTGGIYYVRNNRVICVQSCDDFKWTSHPSQNHVRLLVSFTEELDELFGVSVMKDSVTLQEAIKTNSRIATFVRDAARFIDGTYKSRQVKQAAPAALEGANKAIEALTKAKSRGMLPVIKDPDIKGKTKREQKAKRKTSARHTLPPVVVEWAHNADAPVFSWSVNKQYQVVIIWNIDHPFYAKFLANDSVELKHVHEAFVTFAFGIAQTARLVTQNNDSDEMEHTTKEIIKGMSDIMASEVRNSGEESRKQRK